MDSAELHAADDSRQGKEQQTAQNKKRVLSWQVRLGNSFVTFRSTIPTIVVSFRCVRHRDRPAEQIAVPTTLGLLTIERSFCCGLLRSGACSRRLKLDAMSSIDAMPVQVDP